MRNEELLTTDVAEVLRQWIDRHTKSPLGPEAPATYSREFLRRALSELERLRAENARLKEACDIFEKNSEGAAKLEEENRRLQAILDAPRVALFADGREPSRNETHLLNILSWRAKEAAEAKVEAERLASDIARLHEALKPFAAQWDTVARKLELAEEKPDSRDYVRFHLWGEQADIQIGAFRRAKEVLGD